MSEWIWPVVLGLFLAVFILLFGFGIGSDYPDRSILQECLAHQQWCVEHYKLEEGK